METERETGSQRGIKVHDVHRVFHEIFNEVGAPLKASIRRQSAGTCVESEADDIAQAVFMLVWRELISGSLQGLTLENWNDSENLFRIRTTVFRTAKFVRYRLFRRTNRWKTNFEEFSSHRTHDHHMQFIENDLRSALSDCSSEIQEAFFKRLDGFSYREIAGHQGVAESVVRVRNHRARAVLRKWLTDTA